MSDDYLQDDNSGDDPDLPDRDGRDPGYEADDETTDLPVIKKFGPDFFSHGGALTLPTSAVSEIDHDGGTHTRTHESGWTITGEIHEDYYTWVNEFTATHPGLGRLEGDFEGEVRATSEEAFSHFYENHPPCEWDYQDI